MASRRQGRYQLTKFIAETEPVHIRIYFYLEKYTRTYFNNRRHTKEETSISMADDDDPMAFLNAQ